MIPAYAPRLATGLTLIAAALWAIAPSASAAPGATQPSTRLSGRLAIIADGASLAGRAVLLKATVTNTGDAPFYFWCGGPDRYPDAGKFVVILTDSAGNSHHVVATNGQYVRGSGIDYPIAPGASVAVPLAIAPLPAGVWTLRLASEEEKWVDLSDQAGHVTWPKMPETAPLSITVTVDAAATAIWDQKLLGQLRDGNPFARHVATQYCSQLVEGSVLADLVADDAKVAFKAEETLFDMRRLPPGAGKAIQTAIYKQLHRPRFEADQNLLACLVELAGRSPTDDMLESVLSVAHSKIDFPANELRMHAVSALRYFPQERAAEELSAFLHDQSERVRNAAQGAIDHPLRPEPPEPPQPLETPLQPAGAASHPIILRNVAAVAGVAAAIVLSWSLVRWRARKKVRVTNTGK